MASSEQVPKAVRLREFYKRLMAAPPASDFESAFKLIENTLNEVEDELTEIPFDSSQWQLDGRLYPPQADAETALPDWPSVRRFRTRRHHTNIAANGAIEITTVSGSIEWSKPGNNGKGVWEQ